MKKFWCSEYPDAGYLWAGDLEDARILWECDKCPKNGLECKSPMEE